MSEVIMEGCKCICEGATEAIQSTVVQGGLPRALEIGLVVLVIVLVIVGLFIGFNKLKNQQDDEDKEEGEQYY